MGANSVWGKRGNRDILGCLSLKSWMEWVCVCVFWFGCFKSFD